MPCNDSSSSISFKIDSNEKFLAFEFAKITCGQEIGAGTGFSKYCLGKTLEEILQTPLNTASTELNILDEEGKFVLHLEWAALRSAIAQYLGIDSEEFDANRCQITSIETTDEDTEIALVILPPKEMPKIIACGLKKEG